MYHQIKLEILAITTNKIGNLQVTTPKIAYNAITHEQLLFKMLLLMIELKIMKYLFKKWKLILLEQHNFDNCISTDKIANNTITVGDLANDCGDKC